MKSPPLEYGKYYHVFNRGNNYENIFLRPADYEHFLSKYDTYIHPVAETFAWCLMPNHFHFLLRIKSEKEIGFLNPKNARSKMPEVKWQTTLPEKAPAHWTRKPVPVQQFKHLFNAYCRWFNKRHQRVSSLFEKNFERKEVGTQTYFTNLIAYIHNNPVKHGFVEHTLKYPWTSYLTITSQKPTKLARQQVIEYFDTIDNFEHVHQQNQEENEALIHEWVIE